MRGSLLIALLAAAREAGARQHLDSAPTVGMPARIEQLVLPGTELEAKPRDDRAAAMIVRLIDVYPHGTAFRYDIEYVGFEPGERDLRDYLRRKDGSSADDLPPIPVTIRASLSPGQILPHDPQSGGAPRLGGYRWLLGLGLALWTIGLLVLALRGRRKKSAALSESARPATLADRLRPLVEAAVAGRLESQKLAELERLLIGYWTRRLGLSHMTPVEALGVLRAHEEAGPLLERLEAWLHRPGGEESVDIPALLEPYRSIEAEALESEQSAAGGSLA
jgi:hypothetical protein